MPGTPRRTATDPGNPTPETDLYGGEQSAEQVKRPGRGAASAGIIAAALASTRTD